MTISVGTSRSAGLAPALASADGLHDVAEVEVGEFRAVVGGHGLELSACERELVREAVNQGLAVAGAEVVL